MTLMILSLLLPVLVEESTHVRLESYHVLEDSVFRSLLRMVVVLCIPSCAELIMDHYYSARPGTRVELVSLHKFIFILSIFIPNLATLLFCLDPTREVVHGALRQIQTALMGYPTLFVLNYYDIHIWTNNRLTYVVLVNSIGRIFWILYYISGNILFSNLSFACRAAMMPVALPTMAVWFCCHGKVIRDVLLLRPSGDKSYTNERIMSIFLVLIVFFLAISFFISFSIYPESGKSPNGGRLVNSCQIIAVALLVLIPGRLARMDAVQSDVSVFTFIMLTLFDTRL
jgi:hypothetical protein